MFYINYVIGMTQEDKELFLKDLCARLPYGVKVDCKWKTPAPNNTYGMICTLDSFLLDQIYNVDDVDVPFDEFKPYLFPLSSMTEEQEKEYESLCIKETSECADLSGFFYTKDYYYDTVESIDYLYKNHIDIRGLIPKGLAIDATGLNIY